MLLEGREDGVDGRAATVATLLGDGADGRPTTAGGRATYPWDTDATGDDRATALKLTFVLSGLADVLADRPRGRRCTCAARPAPAWPTPRCRRHPGRAVADGRRPAARACARHGGSAVVVDAPAAVKQAVDVWGPVPALDLMRRVKDQFDPDHRLAPGRFVGGI